MNIDLSTKEKVETILSERGIEFREIGPPDAPPRGCSKRCSRTD